MCVRRGTAVVVLAPVLILAFASLSRACVGARALSMGGAFTGLADDVSASYWNPAALVFLDGKYLTWMRTASKRNETNYQDYVAYTTPLGEDRALALSYIAYRLTRAIRAYGDSRSWYQRWYWLSYAAAVEENTAVGLNVKFVGDDLEIMEYGIPVATSADTDMTLDLAMYHRASERLTLGLLVQDVNEPESTVEFVGSDVLTLRWIRNWRPGLAIYAPNNVIFSAEVYDATDAFDRAFRAGIEKQFPDQGWALRAGWYGDRDAPTLGVGLWGEGWSLDVAWLGGDLNGKWFVSATGGF